MKKNRTRSGPGKGVSASTSASMAESRLPQMLQEGHRALRELVLASGLRVFAEMLEPLPEEVASRGIQRSSVCRHFVARTAEQTKAFLARSLDGLDFPVILVDGTYLGDHMLLVAMGIDAAGHKHFLSVTVDTTESEQICRSLLRNLIDRGLVVERARLFVIDGAKGLRKAVRTTFGDWAVVQRCQIHKLRNVAEHLPQHRQAWLKAALRQAWKQGTEVKARQRLEQLAAQLDTEHPAAAASIREGLDETLTVIRLGLGGWLLRTLRSTNPIENLQGTIQRIVRNVKRWRGGAMALRWCVTALIEAEKRFRRVKGHREMPQLLAALEVLVNKNGLDTKEEVA